MLTAYQKRMYLESGGSYCPWCKGKEIEGYDGDEYDADGNWINAKIECTSCGKQWKDVYRLTDIEE